MARVADHLSISELEQRLRNCSDPVEARHVQAIWLLAQGHTVGVDVEGDGLRPALDRATAGALQCVRPRGFGQRAAAQRPQTEPADA